MKNDCLHGKAAAKKEEQMLSILWYYEMMKISP